MKLGQVIHGYKIVSEPSGAGGARCVWAFAERGAEEFHVKQFLAPKYPLDSAPGSAKAKERKRYRCDVFERRHLQIMEKTTAVTVGGGNLVAARDFFRDGPCYYKVTERIDGIPLPDPRTLDRKQQLVLLRTLLLSVEILHRNNIVHNDLKPDNMLVKKSDRGFYSVKLIDFDDSYFVGDPPPPDEIVGTPEFYSPELLRYNKVGEEFDPRSLTTKSDIFALGLIFHLMLAGGWPKGSGKEDAYPAETLAAGGTLKLDSHLSSEHQELIAGMLQADPGDRPNAGQVHVALGIGKAASREHEDKPVSRVIANFRVKDGGPSTSPPRRAPVPVPVGGPSPVAPDGKGGHAPDPEDPKEPSRIRLGGGFAK